MQTDLHKSLTVHEVETGCLRCLKYPAFGWRQMDRKMIGRSRGRPTTRLHGAIDALGNSPRVTLPSGQVADIEQAATLIRDQPACFIVTDKGYDSNAFVEPMTAQGDQAVIRPRSHRLNPRAFDRLLDQDRNLLERAFDRQALQTPCHALRQARHVLHLLHSPRVSGWLVRLRTRA